jgi:hypothetical protein
MDTDIEPHLQPFFALVIFQIVLHFCPGNSPTQACMPSSLVKIGVLQFLPWLASNHDPTCLHLPSSCDYRHVLVCLSSGFIFVSDIRVPAMCVVLCLEVKIQCCSREIYLSLT